MASVLKRQLFTRHYTMVLYFWYFIDTMQNAANYQMTLHSYTTPAGLHNFPARIFEENLFLLALFWIDACNFLINLHVYNFLLVRYMLVYTCYCAVVYVITYYQKLTFFSYNKILLNLININICQFIRAISFNASIGLADFRQLIIFRRTWRIGKLELV